VSPSALSLSSSPVLRLFYTGVVCLFLDLLKFSSLSPTLSWLYASRHSFNTNLKINIMFRLSLVAAAALLSLKLSQS
ncbi:MAG: hypothetical protein O7C60_00005, partial [Rickettsia endosymbiont of Ixodes persulcatus]|nr:hypothetical protein [Rickettsia endosymbiont of Ixodes persulcatus]